MQSEGIETNPLGTEPIGALMRKFSIPAIISMLVNALYNMVDQIFIGHGIGVLGIAATNAAFPLTTICLSAGLLFGIGGASNFNLSLGRGDKHRASHIAGNSITLLALSGILIGGLSFVFVEPMLAAFGATPAIMPYAKPYTAIVALGAPFMIFTTGASHMIRADGSPNYSMAFILAGAIFNVIFDPIFLFVFDMGIAGIAWATTLGQVLSFVMALHYLMKKYKSAPLRPRHLRLRGEYVRPVLALGAASCFNQLAMTAVQVAMNNTLRHYGALSVYGSEIPLAAVGVVAKVSVVLFSFSLGIAQGCQPINSYNYGAKNYQRVKETFKKALLYSTGISLLGLLVFQLFPREVILIFGQGSEEYFEFSIRYLRIFMLMTGINGLQPVTSNFFTSIGKARVGFFMSLTRQILFLLPLILLLPLAMGIEGVLYAGPIADLAAALLAGVFIIRELKNITKLQHASLEPA